MTSEEKMLLAERIAKRVEKLLGGFASRGSKFSSEWSKWSGYAKRHGFARALGLAQVMEKSPALRENQSKYYQIILQIARSFRKDLEHLSSLDLADVLGYTRWILVAEEL